MAIRNLKIALVEMASAKGKIEENFIKTISYIKQAKGKSSDLIIFPETSLTGYFTEEKYSNSCVEIRSKFVQDIVKASHGVTIVFGIAELENDKRYITQVIARDGQILGIYRKHNIKGKEKNLFSKGKDLPCFQIKNLSFGITICADIDLPELYKAYKEKGCDVVFECASPDLYGPREDRNWEKGYLWWKNNCIEKIGKYAKDNKLYIAVTTQSGRNGDDDFPGGGYLFSPEGKIIKETKKHLDDILFL